MEWATNPVCAQIWALHPSGTRGLLSLLCVWGWEGGGCVPSTGTQQANHGTTNRQPQPQRDHTGSGLWEHLGAGRDGVTMRWGLLGGAARGETGNRVVTLSMRGRSKDKGGTVLLAAPRPRTQQEQSVYPQLPVASEATRPRTRSVTRAPTLSRLISYQHSRKVGCESPLCATRPPQCNRNP